MKRDLYIDFAKGLATLSIIFIHTAFWSGQFYIPTEVRVLSLLFDVPLFSTNIFLSLSFSYSRSIVFDLNFFFILTLPSVTKAKASPTVYIYIFSVTVKWSHFQWRFTTSGWLAWLHWLTEECKKCVLEEAI